MISRSISVYQISLCIFLIIFSGIQVSARHRNPRFRNTQKSIRKQGDQRRQRNDLKREQMEEARRRTRANALRRENRATRRKILEEEMNRMPDRDWVDLKELDLRLDEDREEMRIFFIDQHPPIKFIFIGSGMLPLQQKHAKDILRKTSQNLGRSVVFYWAIASEQYNNRLFTSFGIPRGQTVAAIAFNSKLKHTFSLPEANKVMMDAIYSDDTTVFERFLNAVARDSWPLVTREHKQIARMSRRTEL